jgi:O-methyltransferase
MTVTSQPNNTYIATLFPWNRPSRKIALANRVLSLLGIKSRLVPPDDPWHDMTSQEQRMNIYHVVSQVLRQGVPGALVELGCFAGETAAMIQKINESEGAPPRPFHVYDSFEVGFSLDEPVRSVLERNFRTHGLTVPTVHEGRFDATLPDALPEEIAFVHLDCGFGGDQDAHAKLITFCLERVYPRVVPGGAILLMDYVNPAVWPSWQGNAGAGKGADAFFADKAERVMILYAGAMSQGVVFKT